MNKQFLLVLSLSALLLNGCAAAAGTADDSGLTAAAGAEVTMPGAEATMPGAEVTMPGAEVTTAGAAPSTPPAIEPSVAPSVQQPVDSTPHEEPPVVLADPSPAPAHVPEPSASVPLPEALGNLEPPSDTSPYPGSSPAVEFSAPVTPEWSIWIAGQPWKVTGSGYVPGEHLRIFFAPDRTDYSPMEDTFVTVDANGRYTAWLDVPAQAAPGTYGILVSAVPFTEASKRFGMVEVVPAF